MLFDSDIIIWALRGHGKAQAILEEHERRTISAVTYIEVVRGLKNKERLQAWKSLIKALEIDILPINEGISTKAMYWSEEFSLSHGLELADALIAATADTHGLTLITGNIKDYQFLPSLSLKAFKE